MGCNWSPPVFKGIILHAGLFLLASTLAHPPNLCMKLSLGTQTAKDARKPNLGSHGGIPLPKSTMNTLPGNWQILQKCYRNMITELLSSQKSVMLVKIEGSVGQFVCSGL